MPAIRTADCPSERLIVDFSRGKLADTAAETVSAHLETCADCRTAVDQVSADSFIERLRAAHGRSAAVAPPSAAQADSVSRADSATVSLKPSASQAPPSEAAGLSVPPELVDHPDYELVRELGRGGMGVVYLARNRAMDRLEVLKVVSKSLIEHPGARERFQQEIRSAAKLSHQNIVTAHSVPRAGDLLIFAMEYVEGQDLSQVVKERGPLPVINAAYYAQQAALGLQHAYEQGLVHRDIKPGNLILSVQAKRHIVKILDFGLAKATSEKFSTSELTGSGQILGTPDYMAPEQSLDAHKADIRADIYSLGCALYYLLAGRPPFEGATLYALLSAHHSTTARALNEIRSDVPAELAAVVARMMAKNPADRYQTPAEVSEALGPFYRAKGNEAAKLTPLRGEKFAAAVETPPKAGDAPAAFDPYYQWLGIAPEEQPANHYRLLGAKPFEANPEVIANLADQRIAHLRLYQSGEHAQLSQRLLGEVAAARVCLLNADKKAAYDAELRRSIAVRPQPFLLVAPPLPPPLAAVDAPAAAPAGPSALSRVRNTAARARAATASLPTRLGMHRLPPAVLYTALGSFAALIILCVVVIKLSTPDGELTIEINKPKAGQVVTIEQDGHTVLTAKVDPSAKTTPTQPPPNATKTEDNGNKPWESAAFQQWMHEVAVLDAEQQVEAVVMRLRELNPGFDGKESHTATNGVVTELQFVADNVTDASPVRALAGLEVLACHGSRPDKGALSDLSPLQGMHLRRLDAAYTRVSDLLPLKGMPLTWLSCWAAPVSDFSPLQGMPLTFLSCGYARASDLSALKGMPLRVLYCDNTMVSDLSPLKGMPLTDLRCVGTRVSDLSPLKGMPLDILYCDHTEVSDLSPLRGMRLSDLALTGTRVSDLSPLSGMPLKRLWFGETPVASLSPLSGIPLESLACNETHVSDLSPLDGMHLTELYITPRNITKGLEVIRRTKSLMCIGIDGDHKWVPDGFWKRCDAGDFLAWDKRPGFEKWLAEAKSLSAEKQVQAVIAMLQRLNPGFDGKETHTLKNGVVTDLEFSADNVTDISPVRALAGLTSLLCPGSSPRKGVLSDLSPLQGMRLTSLDCGYSKVYDLTPLKGMPLTGLSCWDTKVFGISALKGMRLTYLSVGYTQVSDLSALEGMPLAELFCDSTPVSDLSPLNGVPLTRLSCRNTQVSDLSPLNGTQLRVLICDQTRVSDLSPLKGMSLAVIHLTPRDIAKGLGIIRQMKTLERIGVGVGAPEFKPAEFWKKYDAGEFGKPGAAAGLSVQKPTTAFDGPAFQQWVNGVAALPAEQQLEAVVKKLRERNPGFDGNETHKVNHGLVTELQFVTGKVTDISPVRALKGLKVLACNGAGWNEKGALSDLSPLEGMPLVNLDCDFTSVSDLSPLRGMRLTQLWCGITHVSDLSPLQGMPLKVLKCGVTDVSDLSPLKGMLLTNLHCDFTPVSDLSPLKGMPLELFMCTSSKVLDLSPLRGMPLANLQCGSTGVSDLSALKGMPLGVLTCEETPVFDLSPLKGMNLTTLYFTPKNITTGIEVVRGMKNLNEIGLGWSGKPKFPPAEFWKKYDAGEFK